MIPRSKKDEHIDLFITNHTKGIVSSQTTILTITSFVKPIQNDRCSIADLDSLNITSVSLLGCPFVPKQGTRQQVQGSRIKDQVEDQGSRITVKDQGTRIKDQASRGSSIKDHSQGSRSRIKDQGPCPAMNEHPGRGANVILRQSKAPIEIFNSRSVL